MNIQQVENYINVRQLDLNLKEIQDSCNRMYFLVKNYLENDQKDFDPQGALVSKLFGKYNVFMYPFAGFHELFTEIKNTFDHLRDEPSDQKYYIQAWLNVYKKDDFINWHDHWGRNPDGHPTTPSGWHGFYCVDCEPSKTTYRLLDRDNLEVDIASKNNQLVISKSDRDKHRTWPWEHSDRARITIAFDIVPRQYVNPLEPLNHWIPI